MINIQEALIESIQQGGWLTFIIVFWVAAILSFSSCTIIRIPIVLGYIGAASSSKRRAFLSVLVFVIGIVLSYVIIGTLLGVLSHFTHHMLRYSRFLYYIFGILILVMGLHLAHLINFRFIRFKPIDKLRFKGHGILGAFIFGLIFAFFEAPACPCCAPALLIIAGLTFFKGKILYGILMFLTYALGQSFPILLIGTFASIVKYATPNVYNVERVIKFLGGIVLIVIGLYCLLIG